MSSIRLVGDAETLVLPPPSPKAPPRTRLFEFMHENPGSLILIMLEFAGIVLTWVLVVVAVFLFGLGCYSLTQVAP
jgi:hypothetical protein